MKNFGGCGGMNVYTFFKCIAHVWIATDGCYNTQFNLRIICTYQNMVALGRRDEAASKLAPYPAAKIQTAPLLKI